MTYSKLKFYQSSAENPYRNLAVEKYLTERAGDDLTIFFWTNRDTVVIGRNQYAFGQFDKVAVFRDNIKIARRLSGGGAVYHDENNLLFSFIMNTKRYDKSSGYVILLKALRELGFDASLSGRNDLHIDGRKFSGNAFFSSGDRFCHHGTVLIDTDIERMQKYLYVSDEKLKKRGVDSVRSRVINLSEIDPEINKEAIMRAVWTAAEKQLGESASVIDEDFFDGAGLDGLEGFFSDRAFIFGKELNGYSRYCRAFGDGLLEVYVERNSKGAVLDAKIFCDSMTLGDVSQAENILIGAFFSGQDDEWRDILGILRREAL